MTPAIILARGGSKGLPGKNKRVIAGHPCWRWSALDATAAGCRVIVSTDDEEIVRGAHAIDCEVVYRPAELASDTAKVDDVVRHACMAKGIDAGPIVVLYGCVPVRPKWLISSALAALETWGCDSVQSYCPVGKCHPQWMSMIDRANGFVAPFAAVGCGIGGPVPHRRQDLMPLHIPDGGVIVCRAERAHAWVQTFASGRDHSEAKPADLFGTMLGSVITKPGDVIDIDNEHDAFVAECVLRGRLPAEHVTVCQHRKTATTRHESVDVESCTACHGVVMVRKS